MKVKFVKMHATGNDFLLVDEWDGEAVLDVKKPSFVSQVSKRHWSVGSDGVIFVQRSSICDARFVFFNPDGTPAEMDGNGIRCFAKYLHDKGYTDRSELTVETGSGQRKLSLTVADGKVTSVGVDMGAPQITRSEAKVAGEPEDTFIGQSLEVGDVSYDVTAVGMGNPHAVLFLADVQSADVLGVGRVIRNMRDVFPKGVNVHFVQSSGPNSFIIRSYERGVEDETLACGTGVCASAVAAVLNRKADPKADMLFRSRGGDLNVRLGMGADKIERVYLSGPAVDVFSGEVDFSSMGAFELAAYNFIGKVLPNVR